MTRLEKLQQTRSLLNARLGELNLKIAIEYKRAKMAEATRKEEIDRINHARELRARGHTHAQIAAVMGYSRSRAQFITKGIKCKNHHS